MKKIFMSFITILLCLSLSSCKDKTCEKDPSQEKCQPAELTCVEDPSQEKCQPAELTCDEDPNQEKCQPAELTCEEEPNQEKCIDSRYANIESIRLNMFGSVYTGISFTTPIEIANFLNEFKILEVEFIEELGSAETDEELNAINDDFLENRGGYDSMTISIKYKEAIETSNKKNATYFITQNGTVTEALVFTPRRYSAAGIMDYQELFTYLDNNSELSYPFPDPDTFTMEDLNLVFDKLDSSNASLIISASLGSSTWLSYNESIINYIIDAIKEVNFVEKLTRYNKRDFINEFLIPSFVISFDDLSSIRIELTKTDRLYITYYTHDISNNTRGIKYHFMSEKITNRDFFYHFTFAQPTSDYYYKSEIVDSYIDDSLITKEQQFRIVKTFITDFADLARFYEEGTKFSGHIKKCYGNFGGSAYYPHVAIMVEFSDTTYELQDATDIIDGVEFKYQDSNRIYFYTGNTFTLQEAFDEGYLTHDNLLAIRKAHNLG